MECLSGANLVKAASQRLESAQSGDQSTSKLVGRPQPGSPPKSQHEVSPAKQESILPPSRSSESTGQPIGGEPSTSRGASGQWGAAAAQSGAEMRQRLDQANDQLGHSLRQLYSGMSGEVPPAYQNIPGIVPIYQGRLSGPPPTYDEVVNPLAAPPTYQSLFGQMREARKQSRGLFQLARRVAFILISTVGCSILLAFMILIPFTMIIVGAIYIDDCRIENIPAFLLLGGLIWATKNIIHCYRQCKSAANLARENQRYQNNLEINLADHQNRLASISQQPTTSFSQQDLELGSTTFSMSTQNTLPNSVPPLQPVAMSSGPNIDSNETSARPFYCELVLNFSLLGWFVAGCIIVLRNNQPDFINLSSPKYCNKTVYMFTFWIIAMVMLLFCLLIGCFCCLVVSSILGGRDQTEQTRTSASSSAANLQLNAIG